MRLFLSILFISTAFTLNDDIQGKWHIVSYDAIERIRMSSAYNNADISDQLKLEEQFKLMLESAFYEFKSDTLTYSDLSNGQLVTRRALYSINDDTLKIKEIDRSFDRKAIINYCSNDSLVIVPIISGKSGTSKIVFIK